MGSPGGFDFSPAGGIFGRVLALAFAADWLPGSIMRVALFTETFLPKIDGIVKVVCLTLEHYQRRGVEAVVIAHERGVREYAGARVIGVPGVPAPFYPELRLGLPMPTTYRRVKAFQPDLIHVIHPVMIGLGGMLTARRLGVPVVASFHIDLMRISHLTGRVFWSRPPGCYPADLHGRRWPWPVRS
jgi:glycosyltransferase involved in cell wall biosynthesis